MAGLRNKAANMEIGTMLFDGQYHIYIQRDKCGNCMVSPRQSTRQKSLSESSGDGMKQEVVTNEADL